MIPVTREIRLAGKSALSSVPPDFLFIRSQVDAVDLVGGHVAVHPLNLRPHFLQHAA
jgi:hypothetical protein